jgi:hypothetical protein
LLIVIQGVAGLTTIPSTALRRGRELKDRAAPNGITDTVIDMNVRDGTWHTSDENGKYGCLSSLV